jgi:hypothetical protein
MWARLCQNHSDHSYYALPTGLGIEEPAISMPATLDAICPGAGKRVLETYRTSRTGFVSWIFS